MIAPLALILAAGAAMLPLGAIAVEVGQDQAGAWRCSLSASSGDAAADAQLCAAATQCAQAHGNDREAIGRCMAPRRAAIAAEMAQGPAQDLPR